MEENQQDNGGEGRQLTNVSNEQLGVQDATQGNVTPAGGNTPSSDSNGDSSTGAASGSDQAADQSAGSAGAEGSSSSSASQLSQLAPGSDTATGVSGTLVGEQGNVKPASDSSDTSNGSPATDAQAMNGESGNVGAGASDAGAPANTSNAAPLTPLNENGARSIESSSSQSSPNSQQASRDSSTDTQTCLPGSSKAPDSTASLPTDQQSQAGASTALDVQFAEVAKANSAALDEMLAEKPASQNGVETAGAPSLDANLAAGATSGTAAPDSIDAEEKAHYALLSGDHPAHSHLAELYEVARGTGGIPEQFISYLETKIRIVRDEISNVEDAIVGTFRRYLGQGAE